MRENKKKVFRIASKDSLSEICTNMSWKIQSCITPLCENSECAQLTPFLMGYATPLSELNAFSNLKCLKPYVFYHGKHESIIMKIVIKFLILHAEFIPDCLTHRLGSAFSVCDV